MKNVELSIAYDLIFRVVHVVYLYMQEECTMEDRVFNALCTAWERVAFGNEILSAGVILLCTPVLTHMILLLFGDPNPIWLKYAILSVQLTGVIATAVGVLWKDCGTVIILLIEIEDIYREKEGGANQKDPDER
jgi:hypothetical protein